MRRAFLALNGPQTLENSAMFWVVFILVWVLLFVQPFYGGQFQASSFSLFFLYVPMTLGLSLLWGSSGILSFGQVAFFGIGGYVYGIISLNIAPLGGPNTFIALALAIGVAAAVAAAFAYFVFYGEVSAWIVPLLTLVLALLLETFLGQTAGYEWAIGTALLGGYNGMTGIPSLAVGEGGTYGFYYTVLAVVLLIYLGLRALVNSRYGSVLVAIREDPVRTRMLGHNVDRRQVEVFTVAAALAALSGALYAAWGNYIDPSTMNLFAAALPVVWVAVGGRKSLLAALISTFVLSYLTDVMSAGGGQYAIVVNGALLLIVMMFFPAGIIYSIARSRNTRLRKGRLRVAAGRRKEAESGE